MVFALSAQYNLFQLLRILHFYSWILCTCFCKNIAEFFVVLLLLCFNGSSELGCRENSWSINIIATSCTQCLICLYTLELYGTGNITGHDLCNLLLLFTGNGI